MEDYIFGGKTQQLTFKAGRSEAKDQISRATASSQSLKHARAKIIARLRLAMVFYVVTYRIWRPTSQL